MQAAGAIHEEISPSASCSTNYPISEEKNTTKNYCFEILVVCNKCIDFEI